jgi:hypothetical protein
VMSDRGRDHAVGADRASAACAMHACRNRRMTVTVVANGRRRRDDGLLFHGSMLRGNRRI